MVSVTAQAYKNPAAAGALRYYLGYSVIYITVLYLFYQCLGKGLVLQISGAVILFIFLASPILLPLRFKFRESRNLLLIFYLISLVFALPLQSLVYSSGNSSNVYNGGIAAKLFVFYFYAMLCFLLKYTGKYSSTLWVRYCFIFVIFGGIFSAPFSSGDFYGQSSAVYLINTFLPLCLLFMLAVLAKDVPSPELPVIINAIYLTAVGFGLFVYAFPELWSSDMFRELYENSGFALVNGLPRTWFTTLNGTDYFQRFNGILTDPILMGYFSATIFISNFFGSNHTTYRLLMTTLSAVVMLISGSKGAVAFTLMTILFSNKHFYVMFKSLWRVVLGALVSVASVWYFFHDSSSSASVHLAGLVGPIEGLFQTSPAQALFGHGYGAGGNISKAMAVTDESNWLLRGAESGVGTMLYQVGVVGLLAIFAGFAYLIRIYTRCCSAAVFAYFILTFLQENLINLNYLVFLFLLLSILLKRESAAQ